MTYLSMFLMISSFYWFIILFLLFYFFLLEWSQRTYRIIWWRGLPQIFPLLHYSRLRKRWKTGAIRLTWLKVNVWDCVGNDEEMKIVIALIVIFEKENLFLISTYYIPHSIYLYCFLRTWKQFIGDNAVRLAYNRTNGRMMLVMMLFFFLLGEGLFAVMYFNTVAKVKTQLFIYSLIHLFIDSFIYWFIYLLIHLLIHFYIFYHSYCHHNNFLGKFHMFIPFKENKKHCEILSFFIF